MECATCGRKPGNEEANFCDYCGSSFREQAQRLIETIQIREETKNSSEKEEPVSFKNWLGSMAILLIPSIGFLVFVVMLFIWSFGSKTPVSKKNWARVSLILCGVLFVMMMGMVMSVANDPLFQNYMNQLLQTNGLM